VDRVWYVAYGSNLLLDRFRCYLAGGRPTGGNRTYPGSRDRSDPRAIVAIEIPGTIYFAGRSRMWGGGMAFYNIRSDGVVPARAYLITVAQFSDVTAQEMRKAPGVDLDVAGMGPDGHHPFGSGAYETVVSLGPREGLPMMAITAGECGDQALAPPSRPYLRSIVAGLREAHRWSPERIGAYLARAPGAAGRWPAEEVAQLADER
jgi:hypothetical protein